MEQMESFVFHVGKETVFRHHLKTLWMKREWSWYNHG